VFDPWLAKLFAKHAKSGIAIDANLLLVYCVGLLGPELIPRQKRTREYTPDDFHLLHNVIGLFRCIISTPNILTEVVNLSGMLNHEVRGQCRRLIRDQVLKIVDERFIASDVASNDAAFEQLGLTDAALSTLAKEGILVLTNDFDLSYVLAAHKLNCVHYNSMLRPMVLEID
jgi:hypothetical protein